MIQADAVLFDLDGTLTNTLHDIADAMERALRKNGLPGFAVEDYRYLVGDGAKKLAERAVRERQDLRAQVQQDYQSWYEAHALVTTKPYDGIPALLQGLTERGLRVCVFSNKPHADTVNVVRHFFPQVPFAVIRGQQEGVPVKPDPAGALLTASAAGIPPERFAYLGDTGVDMQCALRAGMHPVGAGWGFRTAEELRSAGAEVVLSRPEELLSLIASH